MNQMKSYKFIVDQTDDNTQRIFVMPFRAAVKCVFNSQVRFVNNTRDEWWLAPKLRCKGTQNALGVPGDSV